MSTLAHEGNPTEDEIIITAGDVLSTAQLDIDFQFFGPTAPNVPVDNNNPASYAGCTFTEESRYEELCPLGLRVIDRYDLGSYSGTDKLHGSFVGCGGDPAGGFVFQPTTPFFSVDVLSGRRDFTTQPQGSFAGFSFVQGVVNASHLGDFLSAAVQYDIVSSEPVSGFCFWVDDKSTPCNFTGMVAINDVQNGYSYVGYFVNADLHSDSPTIVATGTICPTNEILSFFTDVSAGTFELSKASGLLLSTSLAAVVPSVITNDPNWGLIWLPNNGGGVHQSKLGYGFLAWDIS